MIRFERHLKHPVEKVWAAITQPSQLAEWLADADIEYTPGGKIQLRFSNTGSVMNGIVTHCEPPRLFAYLWNSEDAATTAVRL
ncbi:MAG TPA: SRPBCC domain-containing protein [Symbiobacteriaceae bacterium]|nr:SRPBCC domain-containing protein [Symbiobacteriaceae bacterium]